MKLRVISDGEKTLVFDDSRPADDRDITRFVNAISWRHEAGKDVDCEVTFVAAALSFIGEARIAIEAIVDSKRNLEKVG